MVAVTPDRPSGALPVPRSPLIGREAEIATARGFLRDEAIRVLPLTGPGGVGKTRLALAVAQAISDAFADGARFASLAALRERTRGPVMVANRGYYEQIVQQARQRLSPDAFTAAWDEGRMSPLENLVTDGLALAHRAASPSEPVDSSRGTAGAAGDASRASFGLSLREREVLRLIAAGHSNAEIARTLFISPRTASTHAAHILGKLGLTNRAELIAFAHRQGLA